MVTSTELANNNGSDSMKMLTTDNIYERMEVFETEMEIKSSCINGKVSFEMVIGKSLVQF